MTIYDQPTKILMADWAKQHLSPGQVFNKAAPVRWFEEHYPRISSKTVEMHVEGMSVNNHVRKHHPNVKPGSEHDLFWKLDRDQFRLWDPVNDPAPRYKDDFSDSDGDTRLVPAEAVDDDEEEADEKGPSLGSAEFAFERDLRNYLVKNLTVIESGLHLYEDEGLTGVEFPVGGRFIDILAIDQDGAFVVIELKVSRGYDRVVGQLLRYMAWIEQNMAVDRPVRGVIVAKEITKDLKLAVSRIADIKLIEYEISFSLRQV